MTEIVTGHKAQLLARRILDTSRREHPDWGYPHVQSAGGGANGLKRLCDEFGRDAPLWNSATNPTWMRGLKLYTNIMQHYHLTTGTEVSKHLVRLIREEFTPPPPC